MLPSSGAATFTASGPSGDRPDGSQHEGGLALGEMAAVGEDVRRQHAVFAGLGAHFGDQLVGGAVGVAPRVLFVGDDDLADEALHPVRRWRVPLRDVWRLCCMSWSYGADTVRFAASGRGRIPE